MPEAITHFLFPALMVALFRDYIKRKSKRKFPLHYVVIAGVGGILPDIDIVVFFIMKLFGASSEFMEIHRTITHTVFFVAFFLILGLLTEKIKIKEFGRHKIKLSTALIILSFGISTHLLLDGLLTNSIRIFYPLSEIRFGLNLFGLLPAPLVGIMPPLFDGIIFVLWILYLEWKHKISDLI